MTPATSEPQRYQFVDALRGLAALGVLLAHAYHSTVMVKAFDTFVPPGVGHLLGFGVLGVPIFFVLSGFVIAHSLRNNSLCAGSIGHFILRRQIRLDPVYWVVLALALLLLAFEHALPAAYTPPFPSINVVLLNAFYLHKVTGPSNYSIVGVAWTLCLEIQFYLLFILLMAVGKKGRSLRAGFSFTNWSVALVGLSGAACLVIKYFYLDNAWFFSFWYYFVAGVLAYLAWQRLIAPRWLWAFLALFAASATISPVPPSAHSTAMGGMMAGIFTALALYATGSAGVIGSWGGGAALQWLGRISYSLYLIHLSVLSLILRLGFKMTGTNPAFALVWSALALAASVGAALLLYRFIEMPSLQLAARFKQARDRSGVSGFAAPAPSVAVQSAEK